MGNFWTLYFVLTSVLILASCTTKTKEDQEHTTFQCPMKCEGDMIFDQPGYCKVCKMELQPTTEKSEKADEISDLSIFNLPSIWTTQDDTQIELQDLQGDVIVMVMIYTSCQAACPRLVADMRSIEAQIPTEQKSKVKMVLVSIDPTTDTPQRLKEFAIENDLTSDQWTLLSGSESDTRDFAAVLAVNYKKISPMDFSHSNIISVFDRKGELAYQQEGLNVNNKETVSKILEMAL